MMAKVFKRLHQLWNAETSPADIAVHLCFMVVSSYAFYFFTLAGTYMELAGVVFDMDAVGVILALVGWSNFLLNLLFLIILVEITQSIANAYYRHYEGVL